MVYTDGEALVADTIEELHTFAPKAGVFTFYDHRRRPHYIVDKTSMPTVMAHGAKRVSSKKIHELSNAMARKRELWYKDATDEQIREKIEKYAPFKRGEQIFYEGQNFSQAEMFEIMFNMYKDMQTEKDPEAVAKRYKLPKVLPLQPRQDPPSDRENLADLYNKIEYGKSLLAEEEAKPLPSPGKALPTDRNEDYIIDIKVRMNELYREYNPLQIKVQQDAIEELQGSIDVAQHAVDALGKIDVGIQEHREKVGKLSTLKTQLEALQLRMTEILIEQSERKQEEGSEVTAVMIEELRKKYHALEELLPALQKLSDEKSQLENLKKLAELKVAYENMLDAWTAAQPEQPVVNETNPVIDFLNDETTVHPYNPDDVDYTKDNPNLSDASDKSKYPDLSIGYDHTKDNRDPVYNELGKPVYHFKKVYRPITGEEALYVPPGTRQYLWFPMDYKPQEGEECVVVTLSEHELNVLREDLQKYAGAPLYKVVYDPANPKPGEIYEEVGPIPVTDEELERGALPSRLDDPELVKQLQDRVALLEECERLGIKPPPPGYGYLWDRLITLSELEKIDHYIRKEFGDHGYIELYHQFLTEYSTWAEVHAAPEGRFILSAIERHVPSNHFGPPPSSGILNEPILPSEMTDERASVIIVAEKLYREFNPNSKMDIPSYAFEQVEAANKRRITANSELNLYDWCKEEYKQNETTAANREYPMPSANDAETPIRIPTDDTLPPPTPPEALSNIDPLPPQSE